jgi:hypothetical protein
VPATPAPLQAPKKYLERFPKITDEKRQLFAAMMAGMDDAIGRVMGVTFFRNEETPNQYNTDETDDYVPFDVVVPSGANAGVEIHRPILLGNTGIVEMAVDKDAFKREGAGLPEIGNFLVKNGGAYIDMDGIRVMVRSPQNRLQDIVSQTWAIEAGWGIPTDALVFGGDELAAGVVGIKPLRDAAAAQGTRPLADPASWAAELLKR